MEGTQFPLASKNLIFLCSLFMPIKDTNLLSGDHICPWLSNFSFFLTLKAPRKKYILKMSSAKIVCCEYLPNITDELSIEANSVDPEQTAPIGAG